MAEPLPAAPLTDGEKEQIKMTATYINAIAVGLVLVGGLSIPSSIALNATSGLDRLLAVGISVLSLAISPYIHWIARTWLLRLSR